jgi:ferredoxin--NADP+ reductase
MAEWVSGTITEVRHWTDSLFSLKLHAPVAPFTAGQFAKLALDIDGERIQRAYSYVNAPNSNDLEFYLVNVAEGKLSPRLHQLAEGEKLWVTEQAAGFFVLEEVPDCDTLWMIATGTAIGPYLSILQQEQDIHRFNRINLIHAVRYAKDLSYLPLMNKLQLRYQGKLKIHTVVSREQHSGSLHGRIPQLISNGSLERAMGSHIDPEHSHIMLCGNPQMVTDTQKLLKESREMRKHLRRKPGHITSEHYW